MIWRWPGRNSRRHKADPRQFGHSIEKQAANYLRRQGLRLIRQNYHCRHGEIDLIMADRQPCLVFVEVRYRSNSGFGTPQASVTAAKQGRLRRSAASFLRRFPRYQAWPCRFDVVAVNPAQQQSLSIQWLRNAFM